MYTHLSGPVSLNEFYRPHNDHHIYIFGDWHFLESKCDPKAPIISQFIKDNVLVNNNKDIHLFLETEHLTKTLPKNPYLDKRKVDTYIGDIVTHFSSCFYEPSCKNYSNFTIHAIDFRITQRTPAVLLLNNLVDIRKNSSIKEELQGHLRDVISQIEEFIKSKRKIDLIDMMVSLYDIDNKMKEDIGKISSSLRRTIKEFLMNEIVERELPSDHKDLLDLLYDSMELIDEGNLKKMSRLMEVFEFLSNHVLDYYILCLLFSGSKYSMVYVGENHANSICSFLKNIKGFDHIFSSHSCANSHCYQCLNIEGLYQPLFSEY